MREWSGPPWGPKIRPRAGSLAIAAGGLGTPHVSCNCGRVHATWWKTVPPPGCKNLSRFLRVPSVVS